MGPRLNPDATPRCYISPALFGLGVVLYQYKFSNHFKEITLIASIALMVHPLLVYLLATNIFEVSVDNLKSAVITAAMAPGVNAYLFSVLYRRESSLIASTVLFSTIFAVFTSSASSFGFGGMTISLHDQ